MFELVMKVEVNCCFFFIIIKKKVGVPVPQNQETTVNEIPDVQVAERPTFIAETPVATLEAQEFVTDRDVHCGDSRGDA